MGVRRVALLAIPAFIAPAASTLSLQDDLLSDCGKSDNEFFQSYLSTWSTKFGEVYRRLYPPSKLSGTGQECLRIRHGWKPPSVLHIIRLPFLLLPHSTVEIGCSPFLLPHVA